MKRSCAFGLVVAACVLAVSALGQEANESPQRAAKVPTEGFWPTQRMMDRIIDRITEEMGKYYDFDEDQLHTTRELFRANFPKFLNDNRAQIQTLMNEYFEALLNDGPPSVEEVADWAQRVQPLLAEFGEVSHEVMEGMREYLTDEQLTKFDAESAAFETGMTFAQNKLSSWAAGGYDPKTEWIRSAETNENGEAVASAGVPPAGVEDANASDGESRPAASAQKDEWTIYTEQFIERYQFNDEQKQKGFEFLRRQQDARDRYLRRKAHEMMRVSKLLSDADTEEARAAALAEYKKLNEPIERMFQTLKDRLNTLPTRAQRKAAAELEPLEGETPAPAGVETQPTSGETEGVKEPGAAEPAGQPPVEDN